MDKIIFIPERDERLYCIPLIEVAEQYNSSYDFWFPSSVKFSSIIALQYGRHVRALLSDEVSFVK